MAFGSKTMESATACEESEIDQILFSDPVNTALGFIAVLAVISLIMLAIEGMLIDVVPPAIASGIGIGIIWKWL